MMRELKFRTWSPKHGDWVAPIVNATDPSCLVIEPSRPADVVMQHTGLKDKNGVDIYEGDIIKTGGKHLAVQYAIHQACYILTPDGLQAYRPATAYWNTEDMEVVGNIHQHKGLLS